ncbi:MULTISPECIES: phage tail protein [Roseivirga]|jgi:phage tail-like protein|uniref:Phage tail protein n=1 Tax=Roseivirga thermotolerans TaxID=1758176 RepID=A0ABQ3I8V9_9BACT|nr:MULTISPECIES: phage tail protein [Roseivirga]GHE63677.1 phage tail protein [Roseivirga thermotolerans]|tara:strand:+ start:7755 stop:8198 length:444 start_codon:yes stop_codon:yes gene_type:complete
MDYPAPSFYFSLSFDGISGDADAGFQEASGISAEIETEEVANGGDNTFKYKLPKATKYSNLVLKRGILSPNSALTQWCIETLTSGLDSAIKTKSINLSLLNADKSPLMTWNFVNAYPVKWNISDLKSQEDGIVVETLEFAYNSFKKS